MSWAPHVESEFVPVRNPRITFAEYRHNPQPRAAARLSGLGLRINVGAGKRWATFPQRRSLFVSRNMAKPKFHAGVFRRGCCILPGRLLGIAGETAAGPALPAPVPAPRLEPSPAEGPGSPAGCGVC